MEVSTITDEQILQLASKYLELHPIHGNEWIMKQTGFDPYNLSGRDPYYTYKLKSK